MSFFSIGGLSDFLSPSWFVQRTCWILCAFVLTVLLVDVDLWSATVLSVLAQPGRETAHCFHIQVQWELLVNQMNKRVTQSHIEMVGAKSAWVLSEGCSIKNDLSSVPEERTETKLTNQAISNQLSQSWRSLSSSCHSGTHLIEPHSFFFNFLKNSNNLIWLISTGRILIKPKQLYYKDLTTCKAQYGKTIHYLSRK